MCKTADQINNSYFIKQEFEQKSKAYHPPLSRKMQRTSHRGRSGKVKVFTEEEIFLYQVRALAGLLKRNT